MSSPPTPAPSPPGIELAYDTAAGKLSAQITAIEQLDTKAGIAIAALAAAVAGFLAIGLSALDRGRAVRCWASP
ncbi:MAG TPA: hypothetical protein VIR57_05370 [Chloroflexota bacterium]